MLARVLVAAALSLAWLAAPGELLAAGSRTAVVALVWTLAAGLPAGGGARSGAFEGAAFAAAAAAPCLGLALALDRLAGSAVSGLAPRAATALGLCACAAWTALRARGSPRVGTVHAVVWTALVAGLPLCAALFAWTTGGAAPALAVPAAWSPLGWLATWAAGTPAAPWGALAASLALAALCARAGADASETPASGDADGSGPSAASRAVCLVPLVALAALPLEVGRATLAELALEGPLDACELATEHGTTRVVARLAAGETRRVLVPVAGAALATAPRVALAPDDVDTGTGTGSARVVATREGTAHAGAAARRGLPPIRDDARRGADGAALAALAAAALAVAGLRRRPAAALAAGLAAGALLAAFGAAGRAPALPIVVLEGDRDAWLAVEVARDALALAPVEGLGGEPENGFALAVDPPTSRLDFEVELGPPARWRALAPGARLVRRAPWTPPDGWRDAGPGTELGGGLGPVRRGWRRSTDGLWTALAGEGAAPPPGWLAAGLTQGLEALVLELDPGPGAGERWLRWVGSPERR